MELYIALVKTPFMDVTATLMFRFACAATIRSSGPSKTIRRNTLAVHLEADAGTTAGTDLVAQKSLIANISVIVGAETLWIDVSVVDPGCHHYIQRHLSNEVPDAAAKAMKTTKRNHYSAVKEPLPPAIIPFLLETSGRLSAVGFIQRISGVHTYL